MQQAAGEIESISAGGQCVAWFMAVFGGDIVHFALFDVGRIAEDPVDAASYVAISGALCARGSSFGAVEVGNGSVQRGKTVALQERDAVAELVAGEILGSNRKGVGINVGKDDARLRLVDLRENADATAAAAEVKDGFGRVSLPPRAKAAFDEFGDGRARNEDTFVHVEFVAAVEGTVGEVGHGNAFVDAAVEGIAQRGDFVGGEVCGEVGRTQAVGEVQEAENKGGRFVERRIGAVTVGDIGCGEAARGVADPVEQGAEVLHGCLFVRMRACFFAFFCWFCKVVGAVPLLRVRDFMRFGLPVVLSVSFVLTACSSAIDERGFSYDPWEPVNRKVFVFNDTLDTYLLKPIAKGYDVVTPKPVKTGVSNFFGNLDDMGSFVNSLLQLEFRKSLQILARVINNTVFGLGGLFDVATPMGNPKISEDFGKTLAHYGVKSGPFVVLPFFGPSTVRDGLGRAVDMRVSAPLRYVRDDKVYWSLTGVNVVQTRAKLLPLEKTMDAAGSDKYLLMRDAWLQYRFGQVTGELRSKGEQQAIDDVFQQEQEQAGEQTQ